MFITSRRGYSRSGEQRAEGRFLMLFSREGTRELRALVRYVRMHQCGHFMMASVVIKTPVAKASDQPEPAYKTSCWLRRVFDGHYKLTLSGTYGHDGLPLDAYPALWDQLHPVPADLIEAFWKGGGHNSAGSEGPSMHEWAKTNSSALSRLLPVRNTGAAASIKAEPA